MAQYRKKPVVVEAIKWMGDNQEQIEEFIGNNGYISSHPDTPGSLFITTLEGLMKSSFYDWIIKGVNGEFYPCKPDIFEKTYELVV